MRYRQGSLKGKSDTSSQFEDIHGLELIYIWNFSVSSLGKQFLSECIALKLYHACIFMLSSGSRTATAIFAVHTETIQRGSSPPTRDRQIGNRCYSASQWSKETRFPLLTSLTIENSV